MRRCAHCGGDPPDDETLYLCSECYFGGEATDGSPQMNALYPLATNLLERLRKEPVFSRNAFGESYVADELIKEIVKYKDDMTAINLAGWIVEHKS